MNRILSLTAVAFIGLSTSAFAADAPAATAAPAPAAPASEAAALSATANAEQARKLLIAQGYTNVSELTRDDKGRWNGTAMKDGKTTIVSIAIPDKEAAEKTAAPAAPAKN
jgi:putative membrane protein